MWPFKKKPTQRAHVVDISALQLQPGVKTIILYSIMHIRRDDLAEALLMLGVKEADVKLVPVKGQVKDVVQQMEVS